MKVIYSHLSHYINQHGNTIHILCVKTNDWLIFFTRVGIISFGFTEVCFNFFDDVISEYEVE